jgi:DNA invertase Pin-like site-specific DNA recombinase
VFIHEDIDHSHRIVLGNVILETLGLLADIAAGKLDCLVVYKVDRLPRALSDFAKIVAAFDARGMALVSVTEQLNTTTSMGRLTLNVLLSLAQFERELTAERIILTDLAA